VPDDVVTRLSDQKYLTFLPPGYDAGEDDAFRTVQARTIKFVVAGDGVGQQLDQACSRDLITRPGAAPGHRTPRRPPPPGHGRESPPGRPSQ
jgi:hypothetical protein